MWDESEGHVLLKFGNAPRRPRAAPWSSTLLADGRELVALTIARADPSGAYDPSTKLAAVLPTSLAADEEPYVIDDCMAPEPLELWPLHSDELACASSARLAA